MDNFVFPQSRNAPRRPRPGRPLGPKGDAKFSSPRIPCNPLKRLISHERIQGNPSFGGERGRTGPPRILTIENDLAAGLTNTLHDVIFGYVARLLRQIFRECFVTEGFGSSAR